MTPRGVAIAAMAVGAVLLFWGIWGRREQLPPGAQTEDRALERTPGAAADRAPDHDTEPASRAESPDALRVLHVIDGDTVVLTDGRRVRYIGIDTPELGDPRLRGVAQEATEANRQLVEGKAVRLELDVRETDKYGRTLAYVWVGDQFVSEELLRDGFATLLTIPPNVRYVERLRRAAAEGRSRREERWAAASSGGDVAGAAHAASGACPSFAPIKGNINRQGEKIFHVPSGAFYTRTRPEECFATSDEAVRAGYRASRR